MALNPPQLMDGTPTRLDREYFILSRGNVSFTLNLPRIGKKTGKGWLLVTTARIVLINQSKSDVRAFDIPFAYMYNEKFKQPLFGDDYYTGSVKPLFDLISGDINFKISFSKSCGKFLRAVKQIVEVIRRNQNKGPSPHFVLHCSSGGFAAELERFDRNDPSHIYYYQPPSGHYPVRPASSSVTHNRHQSALLNPTEIPMVPIKRASLGSTPQSLYPAPQSAYPEPPASLQRSNVSLESGWKLGARMPQGSTSTRPGITTGIPVTQMMHSVSETQSFDSLPRASYGPLQEKYAIN